MARLAANESACSNAGAFYMIKQRQTGYWATR